MKKPAITLTALFAILAAAGAVNAQTPTPAATPSSTNIAGTAVAAVGVIVVFAFIVYAGYKIIKKWGSPSKGE